MTNLIIRLQDRSQSESSSAARDKWITCLRSHTAHPQYLGRSPVRRCRVRACSPPRQPPRGSPTSARRIRRASEPSRRRPPTPSCRTSATRPTGRLPHPTTKSCRPGIFLPAPVLQRPGTTPSRWVISWPKTRSPDRSSSYRRREPAVGQEPGTPLGVRGLPRCPRGTTTPTAPSARSDSLTTPVTLTVLPRRRRTWRSTIIT